MADNEIRAMDEPLPPATRRRVLYMAWRCRAGVGDCAHHSGLAGHAVMGRQAGADVLEMWQYRHGLRDGAGYGMFGYKRGKASA